MRALTYDRFGGPLSVSDVPEPALPADGALVRVLASGLCRSDWHGWMGHDPDIAAFPHIPGHEFAGEVVTVGSAVLGVAVGARVTAPFVYACGLCSVCRAGDGQVCPEQTQPGFTRPGSFAELLVVERAATNLIVLPDEVTFGQAAALGCRMATAFRAVVHRGKVQPDEWVVIFGCGGVGLAAIMVAAAAGARVVAVDPHPAARARAERLGALVALPPSSDLVDRLQELTDGGAHVALDCLGSPEVCRDSVLSLRRRGRQVQVGLLLGGPTPLPMGRVIGWELTVLGSHGMAATDYPELLSWVAEGRLPLQTLLADRAPLSLAEAAEALPRMGQQAGAGILLIDPTRA